MNKYIIYSSCMVAIYRMATGNEGLADLLQKSDYELINLFSGKYTDLLRKYYYIGGMPEAVQWLMDCGLINKSHRVSKPGMPLISYMDMNSFKLFMVDIGLLSAKTNLPPQVLLEGSKIFEEFKGALTEQFVAQELSASEYELYYYSTENSSGEIDFVIQTGIYCIPIWPVFLFMHWYTI